MRKHDYSYKYIEVLPTLKEWYPTTINPKVTSVHFCQDEENVWTEITYQEDSPMGTMVKTKVTNLDFVVDPEDGQLSFIDLPVLPTYSPKINIAVNAISYFRDEETLIQTTDLLSNNEDTYDDDEVTIPEEIEEFQTIREHIEFILDWYIDNCTAKEKCCEYVTYVKDALEKFAVGEDQDEYAFSLLLERENEKRWISFYAECDSITVYEGGHIYDPDVGGDSYELWRYTIWNTGGTDGELDIDLDQITEYINLGARLDIEQPDDFLEEDEE